MGRARYGLVYVALLSALALLGGCSSGYAPVSDRSISQNRNVEIVRSQRGRPSSAKTYQVKRGDTLYSIAWRYGKDYRTLAKINGIGKSYRIYSGQVIRLEPQPTSPIKPTLSKSNVKVKRAEADGVLVPVNQNSRFDDPPAGNNPPNKAVKTETVSVNKPVGVKPRAVSVKKQNAGKITWKWPAKGRVLSGFSSKGSRNRGVNIAGKRGDPVYAAASGKVVYAGSGLLGYGKLIIINHNQEYLSAYAHNSRILVTENDNVNVGDKVAEIGRSGTTRNMLHFEIRKDGKPVNPLKFLPKR
ncbi:peptidoglycan DD-metalloendopeptidase family protein [Neptunomonas sp. XY-337]|uniref:peptidoglycan DD-metalloendopeptidase family protein n=1 Tax=Neptunomonas sp. XY-337 TaxID=2561897 RepID=UPI0010A9BCBC|nr:peptidoglycan DD-metalloendopeptidase family protein [Neptunomonas sp. XY-337]